MRDKIIAQLRSIEKEHHIKIIHAIESGSRMWGFASQNSDYDVRFVYVSDPRYYFSVSKRKDCIEFVDEEYDWDMMGWDIKKALELLKKSNMSLYEWINSPVVYIAYPDIKEFKKLANKYWDIKSLTYSYIRLAIRNYKAYILDKKEIKFKKYLYIIRTIAACICIEKTGKLPAITIDDLIPFIEEDNKYVAGVLSYIVKAKQNGEELMDGSVDKKLNKWIEQKIKYYEQLASNIENTKTDYKAMDEFLYKIVSKEILEKRSK